MALTNKSLILYGYEINSSKFSIDFRTSIGGPIFMASLRFGFYSLTDLLVEIARAMNAADSTHVYTVTADRSISGGTQNRIRIATNGSYLELDFASGPRVTTSIYTLIGFNNTDYTGATFYVGSSSSGTSILTERTGYTYLGPDFVREVFGTVNISTNGTKEAVVWAVQKFLQVEFKYEPESKVISEWQPFFTWAIQQKPFEFTPVYTSYSTFYNVTLESTSAQGKGLGYKLTEQLPDFPFNYTTGLIKMRIKE